MRAGQGLRTLLDAQAGDGADAGSRAGSSRHRMGGRARQGPRTVRRRAGLQGLGRQSRFTRTRARTRARARTCRRPPHPGTTGGAKSFVKGAARMRRTLRGSRRRVWRPPRGIIPMISYARPPRRPRASPRRPPTSERPSCRTPARTLSLQIRGPDHFFFLQDVATRRIGHLPLWHSPHALVRYDIVDQRANVGPVKKVAIAAGNIAYLSPRASSFIISRIRQN